MSDETVKRRSEAKALRAVLQMIARHSVTRPNAAMNMRLIAEGALETIKPEASDELAKARQERDELQREIELLKDPVAVHANMLRGGIAKPGIAQILHLYPELDGLRATLQDIVDLIHPNEPGAQGAIRSSAVAALAALKTDCT